MLLALALLYVLSYKILKKPFYKISFEVKESQAEFFSGLDEQISNVKFINLHSVKDIFTGKLDGTFQDLLSKLLKSQKLSYISQSCDSVIGIMAQIIIYAIGGYGEQAIFDDYSLRLEKGNIYGLLGDNGAGKSTLINLMLGLYMGDYSGTISYNGININDVNMNQCKKQLMGVTEQEPLLMKDTIYRNLCFDNEYDKERILEYAKTVGLLDFLDRLPNGLDTVINEKSTNISGGEKQKLSILRQLLKDPGVMIFDEPTSALDKTSCALFLDYIQSVKQNKIIIIISHEEKVKQIFDKTISLQARVPTPVSTPQ